MMKGRGGGGEERRGLNRCGWVPADLTADLQEPLAHARAPELKKNRAQGCRHFFGWGAHFLDAFLGDAYFFLCAPHPFLENQASAFFSAGDCRRRGLPVARPPSHASWIWLICPVSPPAYRLGAIPRVARQR